MRRPVTALLIATLALASCKRPRSHEPIEPAPVGAIAPIAQQTGAAEGTTPGGTFLRDGFASIVERVAPTVVNVSSVRILRAPGMERGPFFSDPLLRELFGFGQGGPRELRQQSLGSGVIISKDGFVLTNAHVVQGATEVHVALADKREMKAKIVGADPKTDIALIRIDEKDLPVAAFGDSSKVRVGQFALAFGDPLGVGPTVTSGIISATGRGNIGIVDYEDFIQTDAAINPGNSGGPLVNVEGELIGINTAIATSGGSRGNQGIGFAVPSNLAREVVRQLREHGRVIRGWLGVAVQDVTPAMATALALPKAGGAIVSDVQEGSPAAKAGLLRGDVIVELDGKPVADSRSLRMATAETAPGAKVKLGVLRKKEKVEISATLGEMPTDEKGPGKGPHEAAGSIGMAVVPLTPDLARRLDMPEGATGAIVRNVAPGSRAAEAGIRPGDVIQEIDRQNVQSPNDVKRALADTKRPHVLLVWRDGTTRFVPIPAEEKSGR
jgi:serine protease Do